MSKIVLGPPVSFDGWALLASAMVEEIAPGTTMALMRSPSALRHVRFTILASLPRPPLIMAVRSDRPHARERLRADLDRIVPLLQLDDPAEIVRAINGSVPEGIIALLKRMEPEPLANPNDYERLLRAFVANDARAKVLMQVPGKVRGSTVQAALALDELSLHPNIIAGLDLHDAQRLISAIALIRHCCSTVTDDEIRESILSRKPETKLRTWLEEFLLRRMDRSARRRAHPIAADDPVFMPLTTGPAIKAASLEMRVCIRQRVISSATGKSAFAITRDHKIALELRPLGAGAWIVAEAVGVDNRVLDDDEQSQCAAWFRERGLHYLAAPSGADAELLDSLGIYDFEFPVGFEAAH